MSCEEFQQQISKLLDNVLDKKETPGVFTHLSGCEECREFFGSTMQIRKALQRTSSLPMPEKIDRNVLSAVRTGGWFAPDRRPVPLVNGQRVLRLRTSTVVLLLLMLFLGALFFSTQVEFQPPSEYIATPSLIR